MTWFGFEQGAIEPGYGNIRVSQLLSLVLIVAAIIIIIVRRRAGWSKEHYSDPILSTKVAHHDPVPDNHHTEHPTAAGTSKTAESDTHEKLHPERKE